MATIVEIDEVKKQEDSGQIECPEINKNIMEQIMVDPMACLADDEFMLTYVVHNGINASLLVEALGLNQLRVDINGEEYCMFYSKPHPMFDHSDVMFNTPKFNKYKSGNKRAQENMLQQITEEFEALPKDVLGEGNPIRFQSV